MGNRFDRIVDEAYSSDSGETVAERPSGLPSGDPNSNLGVTGVATCLHCGTCFKALHEFNLHMQIHHTSDHEEGMGGATNGDKVLKLDLRSEVQRMTDNILNPKRRPEVSEVPHGQLGQSIVKTVGANRDIYDNNESSDSAPDDSLDLQYSTDQKFPEAEEEQEIEDISVTSDEDSDQSPSDASNHEESVQTPSVGSAQDKRAQRGSLEGRDEPQAKRIRVGRSRKSAEKRAKSTENNAEEDGATSLEVKQVSTTDQDNSGEQR